MGSPAKDIIQRLLTKDPQKRLGAAGADSVKGHPFYQVGLIFQSFLQLHILHSCMVKCLFYCTKFETTSKWYVSI